MTAQRLVYTPTEAAQALGVSRSTIHRAIRQGQLPARRISQRVIRIPRRAVEEWLNQRATGPASPARDEAHRTSAPTAAAGFDTTHRGA